MERHRHLWFWMNGDPSELMAKLLKGDLYDYLWVFHVPLIA